MPFFVFIDMCNLWIQNLICMYICFILFPLLCYNYSFIYLYKGYASYIHISRGYMKHKRLRTTGLWYDGSLVTWTVVSLTAAKFKSLIFSMSGFSCYDVANICIFVLLYDLCLFPAQSHYVIINTWYLESHVQLTDRTAQKTLLPVVLLLLRTCVRKRGCGHVTLTTPLLRSAHVCRAIP
jgi:hypothetical protein